MITFSRSWLINLVFLMLLVSSTQIEEVPGEMTQEDLATDDVMIMDTWDQVDRYTLACGIF